MKKYSLSSVINYLDFGSIGNKIQDSINQPFNLSFDWNYTNYLDIIEKYKVLEDYDTLLENAKEKIKTMTPSEKCVNPNQPEWNFDSNYNDEFIYDEKQEIDSESSDCWNKNGKPIFDIPAWYQPAHFNPPAEYGIYITRWGIVSYAESIIKGNKKISKEESLVSALAILWWHELTHAWVEDICSMIESLTGDDHYSTTSKKYNSYIFMEEAICNSSAYGNLASVLDDRKPIIGAKFTENTIENKQNILDVVKKIFKAQRKGYSDFYEFECSVDVEKLFFVNIAKLIHEVYEYEDFSVQHAIASFFDTARIIETNVFINKDKGRKHNIKYGAYGHTHRNYPSMKAYHANTLNKIGGELYYLYSKYGVHLVD